MKPNPRTPQPAFLHSALAAALLAIGTASAQQAPARNDLLGIYRAALANDPVYASARFAREAAQERVPQARSGLLPNISAAVGGTHNSRSTAGVSTDFNSYGPSLRLDMPLYRAQNWTALDQAKLQVVSADAQLAQAQQDLVLRVAQAYFDVLAAQDDLTAIEASKKAVAEQLAQARREFEVGTKTIVDTHEAQARFDQIVAQEQVARGNLVVRQSALQAIIGRDPGTLVPLRDAPQLSPPQPANVEAWAKQAEDNSFSVAVARANAEIARLNTRSARQGHYPTLDLTASASSGRTNQPLAGSSSDYYSTRSASIGVQLTVPIYSGGLTQSRVREALSNEERFAQDLESARRAAAQGARQSYTGTDFGLAQVRALESAEVSAKSQLDSTRLGYQVGVRINLDVLNATTQLFATQRDLKKARYDFLVNGLRLQSAVGGLDEQDLQAVNAQLAR